METSIAGLPTMTESCTDTQNSLKDGEKRPEQERTIPHKLVLSIAAVGYGTEML